MLKIAIWDDEIRQAVLLKSLIKSIAKEEELDIDILEASSDIDEITKLVEKDKIDILFLDIQTKEDQKFGLTFAEELRKINPNFYLIFQTGNASFTFDCFKCKTFDYILKPIDELKIRSILVRVQNDIKLKKEQYMKKKLINFPSNITINYENIYYIEKKGHRDMIHTKDSFYYTYGTLGKLLNLLPDTFKQCHKSYIVNCDRIVTIDTKEGILYLEDGHSCPITNTYIEKF